MNVRKQSEHTAIVGSITYSEGGKLKIGVRVYEATNDLLILRGVQGAGGVNHSAAHLKIACRGRDDPRLKAVKLVNNTQILISKVRLFTKDTEA